MLPSPSFRRRVVGLLFFLFVNIFFVGVSWRCCVLCLPVCWFLRLLWLFRFYIYGLVGRFAPWSAGLRLSSRSPLCRKGWLVCLCLLIVLSPFLWFCVQTHFRFNALSGSLDFAIDFCSRLVFLWHGLLGRWLRFAGSSSLAWCLFSWVYGCFGLCFLCYCFWSEISGWRLVASCVSKTRKDMCY